MSEPKQSAGFTLVEVLVALSILGLVLSTAYGIASNSINRLRIEQHSTRLVQYADAIWHGMRVMRTRDANDLGIGLPAGLEVRVDFQSVAGMTFDDWEARDGLDLVTLNLSLDGQRFELTGTLPSLQ